MKGSRVLLVCAAVLATLVYSAAWASAAQSYLGYSGLLLTPTTEVLSERQISLGGYYIDLEDDDYAVSLAGTVGLLPGLEAGVNVVDVKDGESDTSINAKYELLKESQTIPSVALGITGLGSDWYDDCIYLVAGKSFNAPAEAAFWAPRVYFGVGSDDPVDGLFVGFSAAVADRLTLMAEYDSDDFNAGVRFAVSDKLRLHGGVFGGDWANFGVGVSFYSAF